MYGAAGAIKASHKKLPVPETIEQLLMERGSKLRETLNDTTVAKTQAASKATQGKDILGSCTNNLSATL